MKQAALTPITVIRDGSVGIGVGAFSGLLGVGGGILLVPYLVLARKFPQKSAQATSLVLVATGAAAGTVTYALRSSVAWLPAVLVLVGGVAGAWLGAHLVQRARDARLQVAFGSLLMIVGLRLLWPGDISAADDALLPTLQIGLALAYVASGLGMGLLSALFGIGGGILLVPILVIAFGYPQQVAAGTSLAVMGPIALVGALRLTKPGLTNWRLGALFSAGAVIGATAGAWLALALPGPLVRQVFAVVMVALGVRMAILGWRARDDVPNSATSD
ncbi:MAG: sulfite exporter TauE/SafE family protein [Actinomycetales bacterium]|nr:sulfite exporter TauE/SafE family protein [Actinomycetales bacterium]